MKVTLTAQEIIAKFGLPTDTELVIDQDQKINTDGWISNVGRDSYGHPENLNPNTEIEVKFRDGKTDTGYADYWNILWKEEGEDCAIVAYRVI